MQRNLIFSLVIGILFSAMGSVQAASIGFSLDKSLFDAEILPGTTYQDEVIISNMSGDITLPLHLQLSVWDLADGSEEDIAFISVEDAVNPLRWFSLVKSGGETIGDDAVLESLAGGHDFILAPGEEEVLRFRVRPPNDVAAGTYLVSMRFQAAIPDHYYEGSSGPRFAPEVVALFFLRVPVFSVDGASTQYSAEIIDIGLKSDEQNTPGVVEVAKADILDDVAKVVAAKVKNTGAFYFKAVGSLQIKSWTGRVVKNIPLPEKFLLPGKVRTIEIPLSPESSDGVFGRVGKYFSDNAYLGRYTATLLLQYPQTGEANDFEARSFIEGSVKFWVFPWRLILMVAGITGLLTIFIKRFGGRISLAFRVIFTLGRGKKRVV